MIALTAFQPRMNPTALLRRSLPYVSIRPDSHYTLCELKRVSLFILGKMPQCMLTSLTELPSSHTDAYLSRKCNKSIKDSLCCLQAKCPPPINTVGKMSLHVPLQTLPAPLQNFHLRALCKHTCPPYPLSISHNSKFTPRGCESISPGQSICRT